MEPKRCGTALSKLILACFVAQLCIRSSLTALITPPTGFESEKTLRVEPSQPKLNATTFIYTKTRFDDHYLPVNKRLQKKFPYEEKAAYVLTNGSDSLLYEGKGGLAEASRALNQTEDTAKLLKIYVSEKVDLLNLTEQDVIVEALDQVYKSRLIQVGQFNYDYPNQRERASDPRKVSPERCKRELDFVMQRLDEIEAAHASGRPLVGFAPDEAAFFDSFASQEPGLILGNNNWLGNWRQCHVRHILHVAPNETVGLDVRRASVQSFTGRYCWASIRSSKWDARIEQKAQEMAREHYYKYPDQAQEYKRFFRIQLGICLPESCHSSLIETRFADLRRLVFFKLGEPFRSEYNLSDLYCLPDEGSELRQPDSSGWAFMAFGGAWLALVAYATCVDYYKLVDLSEARKDPRKARKSAVQKFVISMSLIESWRTLIKLSRAPTATIGKPTEVAADEAQPLNGDTQQPTAIKRLAAAEEPAARELRFLDFVKVSLMPAILFSHLGMISFMFCKYPLNFNTEPDFLFYVQAGTTFYVDWYFCITGFLVTYAMFATNQVRKNSPALWLYSIFHRYWRLAPMYVLLFWFCRSLFQLTSYGPIWDYGTSNQSVRAICQRESWLTPITLTPNFLTFHDECILPSWYLANDMQFYLVTPLFLVLLAHSSPAGWLTILGVISASTVGISHQFLTSKRAQHLELIRPKADMVMRNSWDIHNIYIQPQFRIPSYLVGILAGHYAYMVRSRKWRSIFYHVSQPRAGLSDAALLDDRLQARRADLRRMVLGLIGLGIAFTISFWAWFIMFMVPDFIEPYAYYAVGVIYPSCHTLAALGSSFFFVAIVFGSWPKIKELMEMPVWIYLSRINYFVYLAQAEFITWMMLSGDFMPDMSGLAQMEYFVFCFPLIYGSALVATLVLANPLARLETEFVGGALAGAGSKRTAQMSNVDRESSSNAAESVAIGCGPTNEAAQLVLMTPVQDSKATK